MLFCRNFILHSCSYEHASFTGKVGKNVTIRNTDKGINGSQLFYKYRIWNMISKEVPKDTNCRVETVENNSRPAFILTPFYKRVVVKNAQKCYHFSVDIERRLM